MINFNTITAKNFLSIGNQTQAVHLDQGHLTLVLGENLDLGGNDQGARNGVGKAQPLYSKIKTPNGWTTMGNIQSGDIVSTPDGNSAKVIDTFYQGERPVYRIHFADGRSVDADENHLWAVHSHVFKNINENKILSTKEIIAHFNKYKDHKNKSTYYLYTPNFTPGNSNDIELPLDPYFLGAMIGDGSFSKSGIGFTTADQFLIDELSTRLPDNTKIVKESYSQYGYSFNCIQRTKHRELIKELKKLNLYGTLSNTKFIPDVYKNASVNQKIELIQGLVDTDGYVGKQGCLSVCTVSNQLALDLQELVWSIGGSANISIKENCGYKKDGVFIKCKTAYNVSIMYHTPKALSKLPRKQQLLPGDDYQYKNRKPRITNIEFLGNDQTKCILIDHPDHLYITDNYIVTHNTTILNALSYAIYGQAITNIKRDNLINKINGKGMLVTVTFTKDGLTYHIERGRRPNVLKFVINGHEQTPTTDEAQGDSRETQKAIEDTINISHTMFKHLIALNTYSEPFLGMRANDQRDMIEQLLGITLLSEKAEALKNQIKATKDSISSETIKINTIQASNEKIQKSINALERKKKMWDNTQNENIVALKKAIKTLEEIDIDAEIENQRALEIWNKNQTDINNIKAMLATHTSTLEKDERALKKLLKEEAALETHKCHSCGQDIHDDKHAEMVKKKKKQVKECKEGIETTENEIKLLKDGLNEIDQGACPDVFYDNLENALNHKNSWVQTEKELEYKETEANPYIEQIDDLTKNAFQEISWDNVNNLTTLKDHQDFLHKLLTNKDSFIRKRIIDQNLLFLNQRLSYYLNKIGLPHIVEFQNDLTVNITQLGQDLDFDNLSRGERNRLILSLSWAFRDVWENLYTPINVMFIDELIDSGMDASGVEASIAILKKMTRDQGKNIFLISHRDDLSSRVNQLLKVVKENGFTSFESAVEYV